MHSHKWLEKDLAKNNLLKNLATPNSPSVVLPYTERIITGAVNADSDTGIGLDPDAIADANPVMGAGDWVYKIAKDDNQLREKEKASEYI